MVRCPNVDETASKIIDKQVLCLKVFESPGVSREQDRKTVKRVQYRIYRRGCRMVLDASWLLAQGVTSIKHPIVLD